MRTLLIFFSFFLSISGIAQTGNSIKACAGADHYKTDKSFYSVVSTGICSTLIINYYWLAIPDKICRSINSRKTNHKITCSNILYVFSDLKPEIISVMIDESMKCQVVKPVTCNSRAG